MTIKQKKGDSACAVCVAAMATNTTPADVYAWLADGRVDGDPIHDPELAMYLLRHGWIMGFGWRVADEDSEGLPIDEQTHFHIEGGLAGKRAYLAVKSRNYENTAHAVFWDGYCVRDPDPSMPDESPLSDYSVLQVHPLTFTGHLDLVSRLVCTPAEKPPFFVIRSRRDQAKAEVGG